MALTRLFIFRMTHIDNVPFILRNGLWSKLSAVQDPSFKAIGNATKSISRFFNNLQALDELDWTTIKSTLWKNTDDDYDRVRKKMAI